MEAIKKTNWNSIAFDLFLGLAVVALAATYILNPWLVLPSVVGWLIWRVFWR